MRMPSALGCVCVYVTVTLMGQLHYVDDAFADETGGNSRGAHHCF